MPDERERPAIDDLKYLWDEYRYRHELCWSAVYKVSAAVLAMAIVPYAKDTLTGIMGYWMLVPPALGALLAWFGRHLVSNELDIFASVKLAYHTVQTSLLRALLPEGATLDAAVHSITPQNMRVTRFDRYVHVFMLGLLVLSIGNALFLAFRWIPHLAGRLLSAEPAAFVPE
jgi:hypothetical protein